MRTSPQYWKLGIASSARPGKLRRRVGIGIMLAVLVVGFISSIPAPNSASFTGSSGASGSSVQPARLPRAGDILPESSYIIEQHVSLLNQGPGPISRIWLRIALIKSQEPYQVVVNTDLGTKNYSLTTDELGNDFAVFEVYNIPAKQRFTAQVTYQLSTGKENSRKAEAPVESKYLKAEPFIESDTGEIKALARQLTEDKPTPVLKARAIYDWIADNLSYSGYDAGDKGALFALSNRSGDCSEFSYLMIALSRAAGIPARFAEGLAYIYPGRPELIKHDWMEVYLEERGWVPVDPTFGRESYSRERFFSQVGSPHFLVTTGNPTAISSQSPFHYFEYRYWWNGLPAQLAPDESWTVREVSSP